jgi:hypothetical protein
VKHRGRSNGPRFFFLACITVLMGVAACAGKLTVAEDDPPQKKADCGNPCASNICPLGIRCTYDVDTCRTSCEGDYLKPPPTAFELRPREPYILNR